MKTTVLTTEALPLFTAASSCRSPDETEDVSDLAPAPREGADSVPEHEGDDPLSGAAERGAWSPASAEDAARIKKLVVEQHAFVWRSLLRLGVPRADAEDALQQVFMVTARRIQDITSGSERSFLYGTCLRVASRARRTQLRRREIVGDDACPERIDPQERPDELIDRARARAILEEILAAMPIELRAVFTLFELEQMTMVQIAQLVGVPQGTVASRLRRAREVFVEHRKRLEARMQSAASSRVSIKRSPSGVLPAAAPSADDEVDEGAMEKSA